MGYGSIALPWHTIELQQCTDQLKKPEPWRKLNKFCFVKLCNFELSGLLTSAISWLPVDGFWQRVHPMTNNFYFDSIFDKHSFQSDFWPNVLHFLLCLMGHFWTGQLLTSVISRFPVDGFVCVWRVYSLTKCIYFDSIFEKHRFHWDFWSHKGQH